MQGTEEDLIHLAAVRPDDPMPRLVFADWCEERDAERAEFVRLACQAEPADKPRIEELLRSRGKDWAGDLRGHAHAWHFHQGLITLVEGDENLLAPTARTTWQKNPVQHLRLHLPAGSRMPDSPHWPSQLKRLDITGNDGVARAWLPRLHGSLPSCTRHLSLERCGIDTESTRQADRTGLFSPLINLEFRDNRMFGDNALRALARSAAKNLRSLTLHHANITPVALGELLADAPFPMLEELCVALPAAFPAGPALQALSANFQAGPWSNQLTRLELAGLPLGVEGYMGLALNRALNLQRLGASQGRVATEGQHLLQGGPGIESVRALNLSGNELENQHVQLLARSQHWSALEELNLSRNRLSDLTINSLLEDGPIGRQLTRLDLARNRVGGPGLMALANCQNLRFLGMGGNYLGPEAIETLWAEGTLPLLEEIDFSASPLEEKILRLLRTQAKPAMKTLALSDHAAGMMVSKACPALQGLLHMRILGKPDWHLARQIFARTGALDLEFNDEGRAWRRNRHAMEMPLRASV